MKNQEGKGFRRSSEKTTEGLENAGRKLLERKIIQKQRRWLRLQLSLHGGA